MVRRLGELMQVEQDLEVRRACVAALAQLGGAEARPWIEALQTDPAVGGDARRFLEALDAPVVASFGEDRR